MRTISQVIDGILALMPNPYPPEVADNLTNLVAELNIVRRTGDYAAPEGSIDEMQWNRLSTALYRNMPKSDSYQWAKEISLLVTTG